MQRLFSIILSGSVLGQSRSFPAIQAHPSIKLSIGQPRRQSTPFTASEDDRYDRVGPGSPGITGDESAGLDQRMALLVAGNVSHIADRTRSPNGARSRSKGIDWSMRAAYIEETGPPEVIKVGELPRPEPGPGQVLVRVHAAALNPIDLYLRSGMVPMPLAFPYVIGCDLAGTVEQVGQGCTRFRVGDRVWGSNQGLLGRKAWRPSTPPSMKLGSTRRPHTHRQRGRGDGPGRDHRPPRAVPIRPAQAGRVVYVPGGSGGVGSMVVQMAKAAGAAVATSAGSPERVELCRRLGADLALNYKTDDIPARLREFAPEGVDVWYETQREPNLEVAIPLLRKHGRMILMAGRAAKPALPLGAFYPRNCAIFGFAVFNATPEEQRHCAAEIDPLGSRRACSKPLVGPSLPLVGRGRRPAVPRREYLEGCRLVDRKSRDHNRMKQRRPVSATGARARSSPAGYTQCGFQTSCLRPLGNCHESAHDVCRLDDGRISAARVGPRQDRPLLRHPPESIDERQPWWHPRVSSWSPATRSPILT